MYLEAGPSLEQSSEPEALMSAVEGRGAWPRMEHQIIYFAVVCICAIKVLQTHMHGMLYVDLTMVVSYGKRVIGKGRMKGQVLERFAIFYSLKNDIRTNIKIVYLIGVSLPITLLQYLLYA